MGWEHTKYRARCTHCGAEGFCIESMDDYNRTETNWIGFDNEPPAPTAIARRRADPGTHSPRCKCGSNEVERGDYVGPCLRGGA